MSTAKPWLKSAVAFLRQNLSPVATEPNELDWKSGLSSNKERLVEHLSAFGNHSGGGFLAFGIDNSTARVVGVTQEAVEAIVNQLANLGRDALEPPIAIDHAVVDWEGVALLLVHIPEQPVRPVHRRGKSIEHAWVRSGGTTRKASRQEIGAMLTNGRAPRWEELRASLRERFKLNEKQRNTVTNLIGDAVEGGRIKRKDPDAGNKFAEYLPYWA